MYTALVTTNYGSQSLFLLNKVFLDVDTCLADQRCFRFGGEGEDEMYSHIIGNFASQLHQSLKLLPREQILSDVKLNSVMSRASWHCDFKVNPRFWSRPKLSYDQTQSSAHPCVPRPKLQGLESGSSYKFSFALNYKKVFSNHRKLCSKFSRKYWKNKNQKKIMKNTISTFWFFQPSIISHY